MFTYRTENHFIRALTVACIILPMITSSMFVGCQRDGNSAAADGKKRKVPSFTFHKPKEFGDAVSRLRQLHDAIISNDPLPDPIEYQVKEVVHGEGPTGHSHYYLHNGEDESGKAAADDGHETTGEHILNVSVGPIVEQKDIIRWLPKIASAGDMPESQWSTVNAISKEMTSKLYQTIESSTIDDERRASYRQYADTISKHITTLEEMGY